MRKTQSSKNIPAAIPLIPAAIPLDWARLIAYTEMRLSRSRLKTSQLEHLIATFRLQAQAGEPCPTEIAGLSDLGDLSGINRILPSP